MWSANKSATFLQHHVGAFMARADTSASSWPRSSFLSSPSSQTSQPTFGGEGSAGQRLLLKVRKGDRRVPQACALAVPDLQEDMVRKVPEAEGREGVQEAGLPALPNRDAGGRPPGHQAMIAIVPTHRSWWERFRSRLRPVRKFIVEADSASEG